MFGNKKKYSVINNAIDTSKFHYDSSERCACRKELNIEPGAFVIGHVGRFNAQKNHSFLLDIFCAVLKKNKESMLLLVGEGDLESHIKMLAAQRGISNKVLFLGIRKDIHRIYQAMDVFVMPSLFEGLPVSGIEAQACGLPCVFSNTISFDTKITDNVSFVPLNISPSDWADNILNYQNTTRSDQSGIVKAKGYDITIQAKLLEDFYINAIKELENV